MSEGFDHSDLGSFDATLREQAWDEPEEQEDELARGTSVGRYLVLASLGAGSMGVVHAAYDPELDRKVALKFLRDRLRSERGRARLLREAQALARLSHPNVVSIYDVGTHDEQVWIAMEFVDGQTLGTHLAAEPRSWREIVEIMTQAGRGLAVAHAKGLVHRDFKPENVMIAADDGRVRVMDFGLARAPTGEGEDELSGPLIEPSIEALIEGTFLSPDSVELTAAGALMGTPRYMAPEQYAGGMADARSDQWSFCVTLWESVYGQRAFEGETIVALSDAITRGQLSEVPRGSGVPGWLRRVIERGLRADPGERWPGMDALLTALAHDPQQRRGRVWGAVGLAGLLALVGGSYGALELRAAHADTACAQEGEALRAEVWTEAARAAVDDSLAATGIAYAEQARPRVLARLDAYAETWASSRTQLCREATIDESLSAELYKLGNECLDEGRYTMSELLLILAAEPDRELLSRAVFSVASLPRLARCHDRAWLSRRVRPPADPQVAASARALQRRLDRVRALQATAKYAAARAEAEDILAQAEALAWLPLVARARENVGALLGSLGEHEQAVPVLERALYEATRAGNDEVAALAAEGLVFRLGSSLARPEEGLRYAKLAAAFIARAGLEGEFVDAKLRVHVGAVRHRQGDYEAALADYEAGRALFEELLGVDHPELSRLHANIGVVHYTQGAYAEALVSYARAEELQREVFGSMHPGLARTMSNTGVVHYVEGRYAQALGYYEQALVIMEAAVGPEHVDLAVLLNNVGMSHYVIGADAEALVYYERALQIREHALGADHPDVADSLNNLALVRGSLGAPLDEIEALVDRARGILEAKLGPDHPQLGGTLTNLAIYALERGDLERATELHTRALEITLASFGEGHPHVGNSHVNLGDVDLARGQPERARAHYERALTIYAAAYGNEAHPDAAEALRGLARVHELAGKLVESRELLERALENRGKAARHLELASLRFPLARVLWGLDERALALERAEQARAGYERALRPREREAVEAWLATRRP